MGDGGTLICVLLERALYELHGARRAVVKQAVVRLVLNDVLVDELLATVLALLPIVEGRRARQQDESDDTHGPDIDFVVVLDLLA